MSNLWNGLSNSVSNVSKMLQSSAVPGQPAHRRMRVYILLVPYPKKTLCCLRRLSKSSEYAPIFIIFAITSLKRIMLLWT